MEVREMETGKVRATAGLVMIALTIRGERGREGEMEA
jgi:hypothetical protein